MKITRFFLSCGILHFCIFLPIVSAQIDLNDRICADFMVKTFHAYSQYSLNQPIDFYKESIAYRFPLYGQVGEGWEFFVRMGIPTLIQYHPSQEGEWDSWQILPLRAKTGIKWWHQICSACSAQEWGSADLVGLMGVNRAERKIVVAFRGTQNPREWIGNNLNFITGKKDPGNEGLSLNGTPVHRGYWEITSQLIPVLEQQLREYFQSQSPADRSGYHIYFTGHSLGGSVAILAGTALSEQLSDLFLDGIDIRSFAAPAVGGAEFRTRFLELIARNLIKAKFVVRDIDPVPHGIPAWLGYQQPLSPIVFDSTEEEKANCRSFDCRHDVRYYHRRVYIELGLGEQYVAPVHKQTIN